MPVSIKVTKGMVPAGEPTALIANALTMTWPVSTTLAPPPLGAMSLTVIVVVALAAYVGPKGPSDPPDPTLAGANPRPSPSGRRSPHSRRAFL